jgi:8-oxo-dGTP diphosphatase
MNDKPFRLAVRAVILDDRGRCLLLRRSGANKHFVGQWEWPGGKVDDGETFDVAVCREVREETGLETQPTGVAGAYGLELEQVRVAVLCLEARLTGGKLTLSEEHDQHAWAPLAELTQWNLTDGLKELAASYAAARRIGGANNV